MPLFQEGSSSISMIDHGMDMIKRALSNMNCSQVPVIAMDQPLSENAAVPCGGSGFPLSLSEWSFTICVTPYNRKYNVLSASLNKTFPSFLIHKAKMPASKFPMFICIK